MTAPDRARLLATLLASSSTTASTAAAPLKIAIVSPRSVIRYGLRQLVTHHVGGARIVQPDDDPDVVLYDLAEIEASGIDGLADVRAVNNAIVIAVSLADGPELAAQAVSVGIDGYLCLGLTEEQWLEAVGSIVLERGSHEHEVTVGHAALVEGEPRSEDVDLTHRENDVLTLIAQGRSNHEIAEALGVSANSVKSYIRTAYKKIGVTSRSQAVSWTLRSGRATGWKSPE